MIVEDDDTQACILAKWLKKVAQPHEITVLTTNNLEDAIRMSNECNPSTTFLDLFIPMKPGGEIVQDWRTTADAVPKMTPPVIVITAGEVTTEMRIYCVTERGAEHVFRKPYDEGFFSKLREDAKIFAAQLLSAAGDASLRAAGKPANVYTGPKP